MILAPGRAVERIPGRMGFGEVVCGPTMPHPRAGEGVILLLGHTGLRFHPVRTLQRVCRSGGEGRHLLWPGFLNGLMKGGQRMSSSTRCANAGRMDRAGRCP